MKSLLVLIVLVAALLTSALLPKASLAQEEQYRPLITVTRSPVGTWSLCRGETLSWSTTVNVTPPTGKTIQQVYVVLTGLIPGTVINNFGPPDGGGPLTVPANGNVALGIWAGMPYRTTFWVFGTSTMPSGATGGYIYNTYMQVNYTDGTHWYGNERISVLWLELPCGSPVYAYDNYLPLILR